MNSRQSGNFRVIQTPVQKFFVLTIFRRIRTLTKIVFLQEKFSQHAVVLHERTIETIVSKKAVLLNWALTQTTKGAVVFEVCLSTFANSLLASATACDGNWELKDPHRSGRPSIEVERSRHRWYERCHTRFYCGTQFHIVNFFLVRLIIHSRKYLIFVALCNYENILTAKMARFTV